jgi:PAS domain S-box-containing protein
MKNTPSLLQPDAWSLLFEYSISPIYILSASGHFLRINPAGAKLLAYDPDALPDCHYLSLFMPPDQTYVASLFQQVLSDGAAVGNVRPKTRTGSALILTIQAHRVPLAEGDWAVVVHATDITASEQAREALTLSQQRMEMAVEAAQMGLWEWDTATQKLWLSEQYLHLLNITDRSLGPENLESLFATLSPQDRQRMDERLAEGFYHRGFTVEFEAQNPQGQMRRFLCRGKPIAAADSADKLAGTLVDITDTRQLERQVQTLRSQLEMLISTLDLPMAFAHPQSGLQLWNQAFAQLFAPRHLCEGEPLSEVLGQAGWDAWAKAVATGESIPVSFQQKKPEGLCVYSISGFSVAIPDDVQGLALVAKDISASLQTVSHLHQSLAQEKQFNRMLAQFISTMSHEFRTPLSSILTAAQILERGLERLSVTQWLHNLRDIQGSVRRMRDLIDDLLIISQGHLQQLPFEPTPVFLPDLLQAILKESSQADPTFHPVTVQCDVNREILLDTRLVWAMIGNLLSNAFKYSAPGTPVRLFAYCEQADPVLGVEDRGIGIHPDDITHIFNAFYRTDNSRQIPGTGLGLTIVEQAATVHGGSLSVSSQAGQGATFMIRLPLSPKGQTHAPYSGD